ncbi:unnamed protein product [Candidula unifasciata]|uniref:Anti-proliferative protein domain-containing protein n=1 Tax=Candidula unifasciata TaxID=100452 RepID=A0A8S3YV95_9EUPU|nr:unnamed protein product [Candidula unifasciata]
MLIEIHKAVETLHKIAFGAKHTNAYRLPEKKLATFITILTELLTARYENNWYPENPDRGSGYRCIRINNQCVDPTVVETLKRAKIELTKGFVFTEVTVWVDPGVVSVRIGEDGSIGSEVVDEEAYNFGKRTKQTVSNHSGSESDEGFSSSRSSSPESSASERSWSSSPSTSPVSSKSSTSPTPSTPEFNPYSPPAHVSYPGRYSRPTTPHLSSQQSLKNQSQVNYLQGARSQGRPVIPFGPTLSSTPNGDISQQGHIPSPSVQRPASYTRPRALFPAEETGRSPRTPVNAVGKVGFKQYHTTPLVFGGSLPQANLDIPAMA